MWGLSILFIGEYQHSLDSKNRIIVPAKLREGLGNKFVITKGLDGCLYAYPLEEWKILEDKLKTLPLTNKDARTFVRFFFSGACEVELDKQFRGLIPQNLKEYAKIEKDIVSIGVLSRVEIWSKEMWENYNDLNVDFDYIAEKMNDLGI
ncbi:MAG: transcriptional regulator MraZ [Clostridium butyricum]|nr:MAG: Protein MraZ [Clostridium butyricum DORA_1]MDK2828860.1 transcriptional regulator MraZ [Clostridium butyricum]